MAVLKEIGDFLTLLIGVEGAKTPAGVRGRGDPTGAYGAEEAPRHARGKRSTWSANQQINLTQPFKKLGLDIISIITATVFFLNRFSKCYNVLGICEWRI
jgi:hypothetical protein